MKQALAEGLGTFTITVGGCGVSALAVMQSQSGVGLLGLAIAFGILTAAMWVLFHHVSGGHFNPAVTLGAFVAGRMPISQALMHVIAQIVGATLAVAIIVGVVTQRPGNIGAQPELLANGFADHSPAGFASTAAFVIELVLTMLFVFAFLLATASASAKSTAPFVIASTFTMFLLVAMPVTFGSLNPARSTGAALVLRSWPLRQLWLFWVAPLMGGAASGFLFRLTRRLLVETETAPLATLPEGKRQKQRR